MSSPTSRSKKMLEDEGYIVGIVEKFNSFTKTRHDLFGFADLIAVKPGSPILLLQVTTTGTSSRVQKILETDTAPICLEAGIEIEVHGWRKLKVKRGGKAMRWEPRIIPITRETFDEHYANTGAASR